MKRSARQTSSRIAGGRARPFSASSFDSSVLAPAALAEITSASKGAGAVVASRASLVMAGCSAPGRALCTHFGIGCTKSSPWIRS
jgi:hypothetical protein